MTKSKSIALLVWLIASLFYAYQYILRVMPNIMLVDIMQQFKIDSTIFGQFSGVYYIGYALVHLPIGILLDRYGPKRIMSGCILLTVIGLSPVIFADHWIYPVLGRALIGIGSSAAILSTFYIIRMTFSEQRFTRMLSISVTIGLMGAIYGGGPLSFMRASLGYKPVVEILAITGLMLAILTFITVPNIKKTVSSTVLTDIKEVFTNRKVILLCILAGLMVGPLEGFADVWGSQFLAQVYGLSSTTASYLPSLIFIGMCFGAPILSIIAEKTNNYLGCIIAAGLFMLLTFSALVLQLLTVGTISITFTLVGLCCAYQILAIYKASTYVRPHVAGLTTAVANMIIMSFGYAFHTIMGVVIEASGGAQNPHALIYGITIIPILLTMGVAGLLLFKRLERPEIKTYEVENASMQEI